jgi:hypothetical protein
MLLVTQDPMGSTSARPPFTSPSEGATVYSHIPLSDRVANGIRFIEEELGVKYWYNIIDIDRLRIQHRVHCVLGQLEYMVNGIGAWARFDEYIYKLGKRMNAHVEYGFYWTSLEEIDLLNEEWRRQIIARRTKP